MRPGEHRRPGVEVGAQSDRNLLVRNVTIPLGSGDSGWPTVRKAEFLSG
jgi:hypothetical protein